jgi:hypothetical protein
MTGDIENGECGSASVEINAFHYPSLIVIRRRADRPSAFREAFPPRIPLLRTQALLVKISCIEDSRE